MREVGEETWTTNITVALSADDTTGPGDIWEIRRIGTAKFDARSRDWINNKGATTSEVMQLSFSYRKVTVRVDGETEEFFWLNKASIAAITP